MKSIHQVEHGSPAEGEFSRRIQPDTSNVRRCRGSNAAAAAWRVVHGVGSDASWIFPSQIPSIHIGGQLALSQISFHGVVINETACMEIGAYE